MASMSYKPITYTEDMCLSSVDDTEDKKNIILTIYILRIFIIFNIAMIIKFGLILEKVYMEIVIMNEIISM